MFTFPVLLIVKRERAASNKTNVVSGWLIVEVCLPLYLCFLLAPIRDPCTIFQCTFVLCSLAETAASGTQTAARRMWVAAVAQRSLQPDKNVCEQDTEVPDAAPPAYEGVCEWVNADLWPKGLWVVKLMRKALCRRIYKCRPILCVFAVTLLGSENGGKKQNKPKRGRWIVREKNMK